MGLITTWLRFMYLLYYEVKHLNGSRNGGGVALTIEALASEGGFSIEHT